ncbi:MAG: flagellar hook-length control protein FliK [Deltaproteobacteria bacterium]|jgi:hypothetical protein|nr:flagellar hook-length control protein FliK [Deltaproteobacteria bacterium]
MLDNLLINNVASRAFESTDSRLLVNAENFEANFEEEFQRVLERADLQRQEYLKDYTEKREYSKKVAREEEENIRSKTETTKVDSFRGEKESPTSSEDNGLVENSGDKSFRFKAQRKRGTGLAFSMIQVETQLPSGFRSKVSQALLLTGNRESGVNGVSLEDGNTAAGLLRDTLESVDANLGLLTLDPEALPTLQNILLQSGTDPLEVERLLGGLGNTPIAMTDVLKTLEVAINSTVVNSQGNSFEGLIATSDGLNSLGQFLLGLGFSPEVIKSVTSGITPGSILPAATLRSLIGGETANDLAALITEGDLNFLALALQSMGAEESTINGINLLLKGNGGEVSLGGLLDFLANLEKPAVAPAESLVAEEIQTILNYVKAETELVKAPVFNEIVLKLSLLGDRELDRNFFELSPALQALRGGLSGAETFGQNGQNSGSFNQDKREREERRMYAQVTPTSQSSGSLSGAFASSLYDSVGSYTTSETLVRQLREKLVYSVRNGIRRLKMDLDPESLGRLNVELKVKGNVVTANILAESLEAYQALEKEVSNLCASLSEEGLELKLTLSYEGDKNYFRGELNQRETVSSSNPEDLEDMENFAASPSSVGLNSGGNLLDRLV